MVNISPSHPNSGWNSIGTRHLDSGLTKWGAYYVELWDCDVSSLPEHHLGGYAGSAPHQGHHARQVVRVHDLCDLVFNSNPPCYTLLTVNSPLNHSDLMLDDKKLTAQKANGLCNI